MALQRRDDLSAIDADGSISNPYSSRSDLVDHFRIQLAFSGEYARGKCLRVVTTNDRDAALSNDWAVVILVIDKMHRQGNPMMGNTSVSSWPWLWRPKRS